MSQTLRVLLRKYYEPKSGVDHLLKRLQKTGFPSVREKYAGQKGNTFKYLNVDEWLPKHVNLARLFGLHMTEPKNILDIGTGPGLFPFVAQELGHSVLGVDTGDREFFNDMVAALGVKTLHHTITSGVKIPIPDGMKFDIVISLMSSFYLDPYTYKNWGAAEWQFFIDDLQSHCSEKYIIYIELNRVNEIHYTKELYDLFLRNGFAVVDDVVFKVHSNELEARNIFENVQRIKGTGNSLGFIWWHLGYRKALPMKVEKYLKCLLADAPDASELYAHAGLLAAFQGHFQEAARCLEDALRKDSANVGYSVWLEQLYRICGDDARAYEILLRAHKRTRDVMLEERLAQLRSYMMNKPRSRYWDDIHTMLQENTEFDGSDLSTKRNSLPVKPSLDDIDFYVEFGAMLGCTLQNGLNTLLYLANNQDVFVSGIDPLVHYVLMGKNEHRVF
jgi:SAM-dependent methyltransferase